MKKISSILVGLLCGATFASADFLSLSAGAGYEQQNVDGYVKIGNTINYFNNESAETDGNANTGNFGLEDKNNPYVWVKFIYPIPVLPNIKVQYTKYDTTGHSNYIAANVKIFGDVQIPASLTNATTSQTIDSYDLTLFYEMKPVVADIEVGVGADYWKGHTTIYGTAAGQTKTWVDSDWDVVLPYLYGHLESMQIGGFSVLADAKYAKISTAHHYDYTGAVKYTIDVPGPINPFIKAGYRYKEVYAEDGDDKTLLKYKGAFLEVGAKF